MKKTFLILFACILSVIIFQAFTIEHEPIFKNLQILPKDISDHDLDSVMHHFSRSLGVRCNFCHKASADEKDWDFANDEKPEKKIARKMMLMAIDINKNFFTEIDEMDHDMDHDMKNDSHDSDMKASDHKMDTTAMQPFQYMLRSVTCFTCHRGDPHPETKLPPHQEGQKQPPAQANR